MSRLLSVLAVFSLFVPYAFATGQRGDILVLHEKTYVISSNPLDQFLESNTAKLPNSNVVSTSLWRGYVATWKIMDNQLLLTDVGILTDSSGSLHSVMAEMFPDTPVVFAKWFDGYIVIPDGKLLKEVHMGYASIYEKYIVLRVEHGLVKEERILDTPTFIQFRDSQFLAYKTTSRYRREFDKLSTEQLAKPNGKSPKDIEEFLREIDIGVYTSMIFDRGN